jgi:hypothetical protein
VTSTEVPAPRRRWRLALLLLSAVVLAGTFQASGSPLGLPIGTAFVPAGFALMAALARIGDEDPLARPLGLVLLAGTIFALCLGSLALIVLHVVEPGALAAPGQDVEFVPGGEARLSFMMALVALSAATTLLGLFRPVRDAVKDIIPIEPNRFSHALGLATAIAVSLIPLAPLFVLGRPPLPVSADLLPPGSSALVLPSFTERSAELGWFVLATLMAAGPASARTGPALWARLGVYRPALWHCGLALTAGLMLGTLHEALATRLPGALAAPALPAVWLPGDHPWPQVAGLSLLTATGTELTYRGYLQPRLGLVLTNLVLTAPLAWATPWQGLFTVFGVGVVFGALRSVGGTIPAWLAHLSFLLAAAA